MPREPRVQTIDRILDATIQSVFEYGLDTVQLTQIATRADMSARTLSRYYPDKETLLADAASKYLKGNYVAFIENYESLPKNGLSGREKLLLFLKTQRDYFRTKTLDAMMLVDLRFYRVSHYSARPSWTIPGADGIKGIVVGCIEEGMKDGSIRTDIEPAATSALISATYNGMMQRLALIHRSELADEVKESMFALFNRYVDMISRYLLP